MDSEQINSITNVNNLIVREYARQRGQLNNKPVEQLDSLSPSSSSNIHELVLDILNPDQ